MKKRNHDIIEASCSNNPAALTWISYISPAEKMCYIVVNYFLIVGEMRCLHALIYAS